MKKKLVIAVDLDDVLSFTAEGWVAYTNETWGTNLTTDDYDEDWVKVWNVELTEALKRREMVFASGIISKIYHRNDAKPVLKQLAIKYRLVVVTSRLEIVRTETLAWLNRHFTKIFDEVTFTGFYDGTGREAVKSTKADLLKEIGADYLIDDQPKHCLSAAEVGIKVLLFGDYKWNQVDALPAGVVRVKDWPEVARYFDAKS